VTGFSTINDQDEGNKTLLICNNNKELHIMYINKVIKYWIDFPTYKRVNMSLYLKPLWLTLKGTLHSLGTVFKWPKV